GLARAKVGVMLVSPELAASDFIAEVEIPALVAAARRNELRLFCIPVSCMVPRAIEVLELDPYQWARPPDQPLDLLGEAERNAALVKIAGALVECFGPAVRGAGEVAVASSARVQAVEALDRG